MKHVTRTASFWRHSVDFGCNIGARWILKPAKSRLFAKYQRGNRKNGVGGGGGGESLEQLCFFDEQITFSEA